MNLMKRILAPNIAPVSEALSKTLLKHGLTPVLNSWIAFSSILLNAGMFAKSERHTFVGVKYEKKLPFIF